MTVKNKKIFGTDGIRGLANTFPVTPDIVLRVGQAIGLLLKKKYKDNKNQLTVLIGKDTRISGYMLEQALASGLNSTGVWVQLTGPLPTPGIGFLAQNMRVSAGVVISASHNSYEDNGIKIFNGDGFKFSNEEEKEIEDYVFSDQPVPFIKKIGRTRRIVDATGRYIVFAKRAFPKHYNLQGVKLVLDCANGAAYKVAPRIFQELGAEVISIGTTPNGFNINKGLGALYPEKMAERVLKEGADGGISLDGDGDRVIMSDEKGRILNGDHILGICALHLKKKNQLIGNKVVGTEISNTGLEETLKTHGIDFVRTKVGDKNVVKKMKEQNILLGGESSGHIIFLNDSTTGDGCIAALNVMSCFSAENKKLSELRNSVKESEQVSLNTPIKRKMDLDALPGYKQLILSVKKELNSNSRVLVRYSGTEDIVRILIEGADSYSMKQQIQKIEKFLTQHLT